MDFEYLEPEIRELLRSIAPTEASLKEEGWDDTLEFRLLLEEAAI